MRTLVASVVCLLAVHTGWSQSFTWRAVHRLIETKYPGVPTLTTDALAERLADSTQADPVLLDARSAEEYAVSHLRGARRVSPDADAHSAFDTLARDTPIVVYCSVGYRSAGVTEKLREQGFTDVSNLKGSIFQWANEGRPVYREGERVSEVHPYNSVWGQLLADSLHAVNPPPSTH